MQNKDIKVSIVIRTHNHGKLLESLLRKIKTQKKLKDYEIIIIDSSSTDNIKEIAEKGGCRIINIDPTKFSHAYTFNLGAKKAKGIIILYASVDIIPKNGFWFYNLIKHFKDKKVAGVFSKQEPIKNFNPIEEFKIKKMFPEKGRPIPFFSNASGAVRKSIWKEIKYDEKMPYQYIGGEDQTFAREIEKRGYKIIYEPNSIAYHSHKYSLKANLYQAYMNGLHKKEIGKWNKNVEMLNFSKQELIKFLIKKKKFKELLFDLLIAGILMRVYNLFGKLNAKSLKTFGFNKIYNK